MNQNQKIIITGDFNSRSNLWSDIEINSRGRIVEEWMISNNLHYLNNREEFIPTFIGHRGSSVVDLTFVTEDILQDRLLEGVLSNNQLRFRKNRSTTHAMKRLVQIGIRN